jgi:hypothetical protein
MRWEIVGADSATGAEKTIYIDADDEASARRRATRAGVFVSGLRVIDANDSVAGEPIQDALTQLAQAQARPVTRARHTGTPAYYSHQNEPTIIVQPQAPVVHVRTPVAKGTSGFGIAALVLGIVAVLVCWVPLLGTVAIPIGVLGIVIGGLGFLVSLIGGKSGVGMPFAGMVICGLAVFISFSMTKATVSALDQVAKAADHARDATSASPSTTKPAGAGSDTEAAVVWTPMGSMIVRGDVGVWVKDVTRGHVPLEDAVDQGRRRSSDDALIINIGLVNQSKTKKLDYRTMAGGDFSLSRDYATLTDNFGNTYKRITFGYSNKPAGRTNSASLYPGKQLSDVLVFEVPAESATHLDLEIPAENVGGEGFYRFRIPVAKVRAGLAE